MATFSINLRKKTSAVIERVVPEPVRIWGRVVRNVISPVLAFITIYLIWTFGTSYARKVQFDDDLQTIARASVYNDDSESAIHEQIMERARQAGILLNDDDVQVTREEDRIVIGAKFVLPVKLVAGRTVTLNFAPSYSEKASHDAAMQAKTLSGSK
jgi:hypothetical protein